jgi:hypothetical protein
VKRINVPRYDEVSVKSLYPDAAKEQEIRQYLPEQEQGSLKLPERDFFFGILGTLKPEYMQKIIQEAEQARFKDQDQQRGSDKIMISERWLDDLTKLPFLSSKVMLP